jgi:hypothetical protein
MFGAASIIKNAIKLIPHILLMNFIIIVFKKACYIAVANYMTGRSIKRLKLKLF